MVRRWRDKMEKQDEETVREMRQQGDNFEGDVFISRLSFGLR